MSIYQDTIWRVKSECTECKEQQAFPGGTVDGNLPANAAAMGPVLGLGRFHMPQSNRALEPQSPSLCSRACELQLLKPCAQSLCSLTREATAMRNTRTATNLFLRNQQQPPLATAQSSQATRKTQAKPKINFKENKFIKKNIQIYIDKGGGLVAKS